MKKRHALLLVVLSFLGSIPPAKAQQSTVNYRDSHHHVTDSIIEKGDKHTVLYSISL
jgi:hypothetical protein